MIYNKLWLVPFIMLQSAVAGNITAVWANDGGDKVTQDELRATKKVENLTGTVRNRTWDGTKVLLYGAGNEVVSFNLVLEAAWSAATNVSVQFDTLTGPGGQVIRSVPTTKDGVFSWVNRNIELFYTRYFQIKGLSHFGYNPYIELQVPVRFKAATGLWKDRPDHDKFYPDVLIPLEAIPTFSIVSGNNQSIWADIYIPPSAPAGIYTGTVTIKENGTNAISVPVQLQVYGFALPDVPSSKMMSVYSPQDILIHNFNTTYLDPTTPQGKQAKVIRDRYFALAHRHKMALLGDPQTCTVADAVCWEDVGRLTGSTFSTANGYDGPGRDHGQDVYSIGTYGTWNWRYGTKADMWRRTDAWENWFVQNLPNTERFLYLLDEPHQAADLAQVETWAGWMKSNPGPGKALQSFSTLSLTTALTKVPSLSIPCTYAGFSDTAPMTAAAHYYRTTPGKQLWAYNGSRPAIGSFVTEDDGVSMRQLSWGQYKLGIRRWMYWMLNGGAADPLGQALSFGDIAGRDPATGDSSSMYSNGEGVLVYPGTDVKNPHNSYGLSGPMASVRLKQLRRGIQDVDYLAKAAVINPAAVQLLVNQMVPKALWEVGVADPKDPSWVIAGITWPVDPDAWESARAQLAAIILGSAPSTPVPVIPDPPVISNIAVTNVTPTSATVSWSTNNPADGQVDYGTTTAYGFASASANNFQGALNHSVTLSSLTSNTAYHFRVRSKTATSNATVSNDRMFTTTAATTPLNIFGNMIPSNCVADPNPVELGVKFRSDIAGNVTGIRFYKYAGSTGSHSGSLWSSTGSLLASGTFSGESASGWQQMTFSAPVPISANTTYVASYHTTGWCVDWSYFSGKGADNGSLHALAARVDGPNGIYMYGPGGQFPVLSSASSNYWADILFTITPSSPTVAQPVFNRLPGTYTSAQLVTLSTTTQSASIRYTSDGITTPSATVGTLYSGPITIGATTTIKAIAYAAGMANSATITGTFTINTSPAAANIFGNMIPSNCSADPNPVELGVKFRSDIAGKVTGIRFYKYAGSTGSHSGSLWSSTGSLLATGTFSGESASGWQQMTFSAPVPISANTTYVASYHTTGWCVDWSYFSGKGADNGSLHALAAGVDGPNGVYIYGPGGQFPGLSSASSNYWVDILFN